VADVVEAMASHRPYRPAHGVDDALEFVISEAGRTLDDAAVRACVELVRSGQLQVITPRQDHTGGAYLASL
jgi:HD-GYP domain-containing protein (c-di-GMP phosphodiesterase class II)